MTRLRRSLVSAAFATTLSALLVGCAAPAGPVAAVVPPPATLADVLAREPQLSTLNRLVIQAGLVDTLRGPGPLTIFAPSDEAFAAVPPATMSQLGSDQAALRAVLTHHVLPARRPAAEVVTGSAKTAGGGDLALSRSGTFVTVDDAVVQRADLSAGNGVAHVIDRVLVPPKR